MFSFNIKNISTQKKLIQERNFFNFIAVTLVLYFFLSLFFTLYSSLYVFNVSDSLSLIAAKFSGNFATRLSNLIFFYFAAIGIAKRKFLDENGKLCFLRLAEKHPKVEEYRLAIAKETGRKFFIGDLLAAEKFDRKAKAAEKKAAEEFDKKAKEDVIDLQLFATKTPTQHERNIQKALTDKNALARRVAVESCNLTPAQQQAALNDGDCKVRLAAVRLGNLTPAQQQAALDDEHWYVRLAAVRLGGLTKEQQQKLLNDESRFVREAVVKSGGLTLAQHEKALNDVAKDVRLAAVELGGLTDKQRQKALNDEHEEVRKATVGLGD